MRSERTATPTDECGPKTSKVFSFSVTHFCRTRFHRRNTYLHLLHSFARCNPQTKRGQAVDATSGVSATAAAAHNSANLEAFAALPLPACDTLRCEPHPRTPHSFRPSLTPRHDPFSLRCTTSLLHTRPYPHRVHTRTETSLCAKSPSTLGGVVFLHAAVICPSENDLNTRGETRHGLSCECGRLRRFYITTT
jgi:hypothetical protein